MTVQSSGATSLDGGLSRLKSTAREEDFPDGINGHGIKESLQVSGQRLWSELERDGFCQAYFDQDTLPMDEHAPMHEAKLIPVMGMMMMNMMMIILRYYFRSSISFIVFLLLILTLSVFRSSRGCYE